MKKTPYYVFPTFPSFPINQKQQVHMMDIVAFLRYVVNKGELEVSEYLGQITQDPFFLVAATGIGKTVVIPIHALLLQLQRAGQTENPEPHIWVIEPRIPIAVEQTGYMNSLWDAFSRKRKRPRLPPLFGCISSKGTINPDAPITFVTTGVFGLMAKGGRLSANRDRVIIDEAHVTVEQNAEVELGIALFKAAGGTVDYMSATVDTANLEEALGVSNIIRADKYRYDVWKHNLSCTLDEGMIDLVDATLIRQDLSSNYYPQPGSFEGADELRRAVTEPGRSHGLLAVVNSYAGNQSDTQRLAEMIRQHYPNLPVLQLASEVIRDPRRADAFDAELTRIEANHQNYVILSTCVVEMGVTYGTLDYVVSMDSGYDQETIGDVAFPVVAPLGTGSLWQRLGRVGRKRPGIGYISREIGADYTKLDDATLNKGGLKFQPISFPMATAPLTPLAYYGRSQGWENTQEAVSALKLPSRVHENADRMAYLAQQMTMLDDLGISDGRHLTPFGKRMEQWIGRADLAYATQLQKRFEAGADLPEVLFWVVSTALSNTPLVTLRASGDYFVDYNGSYPEGHAIELWSDCQFEDVAAFRAIAWAVNIVPGSFRNDSEQVFCQSDEDDLNRWSSLTGFNARKLTQAIKAIQEVWQLFCRFNRKSEPFARLLNNAKGFEFSDLDWQSCVEKLDTNHINAQLRMLPGNIAISFELENWRNGKFVWSDDLGRTGTVRQNDTPIQMVPGLACTARLIPGRQSKDSAVNWRLAHLGLTTTTSDSGGVKPVAASQQAKKVITHPPGISIKDPFRPTEAEMASYFAMANKRPARRHPSVPIDATTSPGHSEAFQIPQPPATIDPPQPPSRWRRFWQWFGGG